MLFHELVHFSLDDGEIGAYVVQSLLYPNTVQLAAQLGRTVNRISENSNYLLAHSIVTIPSDLKTHDLLVGRQFSWVMSQTLSKRGGEVSCCSSDRDVVFV